MRRPSHKPVNLPYHQCGRKVAFPDRAGAMDSPAVRGGSETVYRCQWCGQWHRAKNWKGKKKRRV